MNLARVLLAVALAAGFGTSWAVLRGREARRAGAARRGDGLARSETLSAVLTVLRGTCGFLAVVFLLKIVPALAPPRGLLRDDFLFPLWALWRPATAWWWFAPAIVFAGAMGALWWRGIAARARDGTFLACGVVLACGLWTSLSLTHEGYPEGLVAPFERSADYQADVGRFSTFGAIWSGYNDAQPTLSVHGRTHPPGAVAVLWVLGRASGGRLPLICLAVVLIGALALVPLYLWARRLLTPGEARTACLLWIFTPAVTLYGATCMDMVFGVVLVAALATFTAMALDGRGDRAEDRGAEARTPPLTRSAGLGALLGAELAAGFLFTFSTAVLGAALALTVGARLARRERGAGRLALCLALSALVSFALLVALRPAVGFDWLACLRTAVRLDALEASPWLSPGYYLTTRLMDALDFLVLAGVAAAPAWLTALKRGVPARSRPLSDTRDADALLQSLSRMAVVAVGAFFLLGAYKIGETGRIFVFLMPLVAALVARRWGAEGSREPSGLRAECAALAALLVVHFAQTLLMQGFLDTRW